MSQPHEHEHRPFPQGGDAETVWEQRYQERDQIWSGRPNATLVAEVSGVTPGRALDLGCGEGADSIWLAEQGWEVVGLDVSPTALARAVGHAEERGVADRIEWEARDLATGVPDGPFDLVSAQFLHSESHLPREEVLRAAAATVAPGGTLLIVGHAAVPPWAPEPKPVVHLPSPEEVVAALELDDGWTVERCELVGRDAHGPHGMEGHLDDAIVRVRRAD